MYMEQIESPVTARESDMRTIIGIANGLWMSAAIWVAFVAAVLAAKG